MVGGSEEGNWSRGQSGDRPAVTPGRWRRSARWFRCRPVLLLLLLAALPVRGHCWEAAERRFGIERRLLMAIALTESGMNPRSVRNNANGSRDIGLMQINSVHLPRLRRLGIDEKRLSADSCLSLMVGASVLSGMMQRYGYGWEAVGAYNAGTAAARHAMRMRYARRVWENYLKLDTKNPPPLIVGGGRRY